MSTLNLSWNTIHDGIEALAYMLKPLKPRLIVGVARGGLVPATLLSHRLDVRLTTISASAYEGTRRTLDKPIRVTGWKPDFNQPDVIVVDDIKDSGDTLQAILACADGFASKFKYACLVTKEIPIPGRTSGCNIHFFAYVPKDVWVNFPWEHYGDSDANKETISNRGVD